MTQLIPQKAVSTTLITAALLTSSCSTPVSELKLYQSSDWVGDGVFTTGVEGPAVDASGRLYAVNFRNNGTIGRVTAKNNAELFLELPNNSIGNGIRFDTNNNMYIADYIGHNILKVDMQTKAIRVHAHEPAMNQPNDIAITASGTLYASDPNWQNNTGKLWKIDSRGQTTLLEDNMGTTNGVEVSPDGKHLYVNESVQRKIYVYDILPDDSVANKRLLIEFNDHGLDGMRCDDQGNLYVARYGAGVVAMISPTGQLLREIPLTGQHPTNVAFGGTDGRQVFVTMQQRGAIETFMAENPGRSWMLQSSLVE